MGLEELGHECVFACEKKQSLIDLYEYNYGIRPHEDITTVLPSEIPKHDILCAGFPCQPFSKAGMQNGLLDDKNGYLFDYIVEILAYHRPKYFILENVRNLENHEQGKTLKYIIQRLQGDLGYDIDYNILSPHDFGIPQHRERFFMVGSTKALNFSWPKKSSKKSSVHDILDNDLDTALSLEESKIKVLEVWQRFLSSIPKNVSIPGPLWSMEFNATYPYIESTPFAASSRALGKTRGNFGTPLIGMSRTEKFENLPSYARVNTNNFPKWKQRFIYKNREFNEIYGQNFKDIVEEIKDFGVPSWQKLEWNLKGEKRDIFDCIIQFRGSGIRLKRKDYFPSLVTVSTQIPIIGWQRRYLSTSEGAALQSLDGIKLPNHNSSAFAALGNAVNARLVQLIAVQLFSHREHEDFHSTWAIPTLFA